MTAMNRAERRRQKRAELKSQVEMWCLHCTDKYMSNEAVWEIRTFGRKQTKNDEPMLWCKNPECDGAGIGYDLLLMSETKEMYEQNVEYMKEHLQRKKAIEEIT
jgi:hypothetical protein